MVEIARRRPRKLGLPFTHWSIRKLANYLSGRYGRTDPAQLPHRIVRIGRERVRAILHAHDITFQRTRTWKESRDPAKDAKLDRIEEVMSRFPDRVFAFDQFGPLSIRPCHGTCWATTKHPDRLPATYHRYHGVRYFHGPTTWPATNCGVCCTSTRAVHTPSPPSRASVPRAPTAHRSTS